MTLLALLKRQTGLREVMGSIAGTEISLPYACDKLII